MVGIPLYIYILHILYIYINVCIAFCLKVTPFNDVWSRFAALTMSCGSADSSTFLIETLLIANSSNSPKFFQKNSGAFILQ